MTNISLHKTVSGNNVDCSQYEPSIDIPSPLITLSPNENKIITITGCNFTPTSIITSNELTVNSVTYISCNELELDVTASGNIGVTSLQIETDCGIATEDIVDIQNFSCTLVPFQQYGGANYNVVTTGEVVRLINTGWGAHGAFNNTFFIRNSGEYVEFTVTEQAFVVGVTYNSNPTAGWVEENFSIYNPNGNFYTRTDESWQTHGVWNNGDVIRIEVNTSNQVEIYRNNVLLRTSISTVTGNLYPHMTSGTGNVGTTLITNYQVCK